jgi:NAD(P)H dehydrogenase (quinone)
MTRPNRVLIVHAHPEPTSFSGALTRQAVDALRSAGDEVIVSDLYAMGFDPVSDRRNFAGAKDGARFFTAGRGAGCTAAGAPQRRQGHGVVAGGSHLEQLQRPC